MLSAMNTIVKRLNRSYVDALCRDALHLRNDIVACGGVGDLPPEAALVKQDPGRVSVAAT